MILFVALATRAEAEFGTFIFLLLAVGVAVAVILFNLKARRDFQEACARAAAKLGGEFRAAGFIANPTLRYAIRGREALMELYRGSRNSRPWTRVSVDARGRSPGALRLVPQGFVQSLQKLFGAQDVEVGEPWIDEFFVIKSTPEYLARRVFVPERRTRLRQVLQTLTGYGPLSVELTRESLSARVEERVSDAPSMLQLADAFSELAGLVLDLESSNDIRWLEDVKGGIGLCQVCGSEMKEGVVYCASCRTPHHEECWTYTGECSTFACKERRFVRAGP